MNIVLLKYLLVPLCGTLYLWLLKPAVNQLHVPARVQVGVAQDVLAKKQDEIALNFAK